MSITYSTIGIAASAHNADPDAVYNLDGVQLSRALQAAALSLCHRCCVFLWTAISREKSPQCRAESF